MVLLSQGASSEGNVQREGSGYESTTGVVWNHHSFDSYTFLNIIAQTFSGVFTGYWVGEMDSQGVRFHVLSYICIFQRNAISSNRYVAKLYMWAVVMRCTSDEDHNVGSEISRGPSLAICILSKHETIHVKITVHTSKQEKAPSSRMFDAVLANGVAAFGSVRGPSLVARQTGVDTFDTYSL